MLQAQLAAKQAALTELDVLANAAGTAAAQNSALSTELADKARALADQDRKIAAMRDQVDFVTLSLNDGDLAVYKGYFGCRLMSVERKLYSCNTAICQGNGVWKENSNHCILLFFFLSDSVNMTDIRMCQGLTCMQRGTPVGLYGADAGCNFVA